MAVSDIEIKTTGQLLDELITNNVKCFMLQEKLMNEILSDKDRSDVAVGIQRTNSKRTDLIRALDSRLNSPGVTNAEKSYRGSFNK